MYQDCPQNLVLAPTSMGSITMILSLLPMPPGTSRTVRWWGGDRDTPSLFLKEMPQMIQQKLKQITAGTVSNESKRAALH